MPILSLVPVALDRQGPLASAAAVVLAALACWGSWRGRRKIEGTTLLAPWFWTLGCLIVLGTVEAWLDRQGAATGPWATHARFAAAAWTFAPLMAVLEARRPHDRGWQFVVAALLLVVIWPAGEALLYRPESALVLHPARRGFHLLLVAVGLANGLGTRRGLAAALWAVGQMLLLADQLPALALGWLPVLLPSASARALAGLAALAGSQVLWGLDLPRPAPDRGPFDRLWRDFRDEFGAFWALRTIERFNAAARTCSWEIRLEWGGWVEAGKPLAGAPTLLAPQPRQVLQNLLRRFVSAEWIAERWAGS